MVTANGRLITVFQLPGTGSRQVSPSPYSSVQALTEVMRFVPPLALRQAAEANGYTQFESRTIVSKGRKPFQVEVFVACSSTGSAT
jgi:hypothetical protein